MGVSLTDRQERYRELLQHVGHEIVVAIYGDPASPLNVAIECETCQEVLVEADRDSEEGED